MLVKATFIIRSDNIHGEAPVWSPEEQALYWVDVSRRQLQRYDLASEDIETWQMPKRATSLALRRTAGNVLLALEDGLYAFDLAQQTPQLITAMSHDNQRTRLSDGKCDRAGRFWIGTMDDQEQEPLGALYRYDAAGGLQTFETQIVAANGPAFSPDNMTMYFVDSGLGLVYAYQFDLQMGTLHNRRIFASTQGQPGRPGGITVDAEGFLWCAFWDGWEVVRYAPDGRVDRVLPVPVQRPTSVQFGGERMDILFVTTAKRGLNGEQLARQPEAGCVLAIDAGVKGVPEPRFAG